MNRTRIFFQNVCRIMLLFAFNSYMMAFSQNPTDLTGKVLTKTESIQEGVSNIITERVNEGFHRGNSRS